MTEHEIHEEEAEREERSSRMRMPCRESQSSIP